VRAAPGEAGAGSQWSGQLGKTQKESFAAKGLKEPKEVFVAAFVRTRFSQRRAQQPNRSRLLAQRTPGSTGSPQANTPRPAAHRCRKRFTTKTRRHQGGAVASALCLSGLVVLYRRSAGPARRFAACQVGATFLCCRRDEKNKVEETPLEVRSITLLS